MSGLGGIADRLGGLAMSGGTQSHPWPRSPQLLSGLTATRNLADAVHHICMLHGDHPGLIDIAASRADDPTSAPWLKRVAAAFVAERAYLARLLVAAGPMPSTHGQAECEAAVVGQRHAIETLAQSDRGGCALGAAIGLVLDWQAIRVVLDIAAARFGIAVERPDMPGAAEAAETARNASRASLGIDRAMWFGAQQLLVQNHGLWDLLEARAAARIDS